MSMPPVIGYFRLLSGIVWVFFKSGRVSDHGLSFNWPVRVHFEDADSGGIVYYASYLKFMERACASLAWMLIPCDRVKFPIPFLPNCKAP